MLNALQAHNLLFDTADNVLMDTISTYDIIGSSASFAVQQLARSLRRFYARTSSRSHEARQRMRDLPATDPLLPPVPWEYSMHSSNHDNTLQELKLTDREMRGFAPCSIFGTPTQCLRTSLQNIIGGSTRPHHEVITAITAAIRESTASAMSSEALCHLSSRPMPVTVCERCCQPAIPSILDTSSGIGMYFTNSWTVYENHEK